MMNLFNVLFFPLIDCVKMSDDYLCSSQLAHHSGYLFKLGGKIFSTNQKRWFVLKGDTLFYTKTPESTEVLGQIKLPGTHCKDNAKKPNLSFVVFGGHLGKEYIFEAENEAEKIQWTSKISAIQTGTRSQPLSATNGSLQNITSCRTWSEIQPEMNNDSDHDEDRGRATYLSDCQPDVDISVARLKQRLFEVEEYCQSNLPIEQMNEHNEQKIAPFHVRIHDVLNRIGRQNEIALLIRDVNAKLHRTRLTLDAFAISVDGPSDHEKQKDDDVASWTKVIGDRYAGLNALRSTLQVAPSTVERIEHRIELLRHQMKLAVSPTLLDFAKKKTWREAELQQITKMNEYCAQLIALFERVRMMQGLQEQFAVTLSNRLQIIVSEIQRQEIWRK